MMKIRLASGLRLEGLMSNLQLVEPIKGIAYNLQILNEPLLLEVISSCGSWIKKDDLIDLIDKKYFDLSKENIKETVDHLVEAGLLEENGVNSAIAEDNIINLWEENGWQEPFSYHLYTNSLTKTNYSEDIKGIADKAKMREYIQEEEQPSAYKDYSYSSLIPLIDHQVLNKAQKDLTNIFTSEVTSGKNKEPLSFEDFSWYTYLAFGQTATRKLPITGSHIAKTIPSGGSRHPTEVYFVINGVEQIIPGLYHYNVRNHAIALLKEGNQESFLNDNLITLAKRVRFLPRVACIFTCIFERSMYRYREARSYRVMQYDVGHLMQNAAYLASAIDRSTYRGYSFKDTDIEKFLNIDGFYESALSYMLLG